MLDCILHIADFVILLLSNKTIVSEQSSYFISGWLDTVFLQGFDAVDWAAGRASGL